MSSPCFTGGGARAYGFENTIVSKPPSSSLRSPVSASSSSTVFSDASTTTTASLTIATKKQRAPRKRPNQVYSEAAALLSTVYPNVFFSAHNSTKPPQRAKSQSFVDESAELVEEPLIRFIAAETQLLIFRPPAIAASHEPGVRPGLIQLNCGDDKTNSSVENRSSTSEDFSDSEVSVIRAPSPYNAGKVSSNVGSQSASEIQSRRFEFSDSDLLLSPVGSTKETEQSVAENATQLSSGNQSEVDETEHTVDGKPVSAKSCPENQLGSGDFSEEAGSQQNFKEFDDELEEGSLLDGDGVDRGIDGILGRKEAHDDYEQNQSPHDYHYNSVTDAGYETPLADHWALRRARDRVPATQTMEIMPRLRLVDKIMAQEEQSSMAFCSFEWVKKEDNSPSGLSLKLNHDKVMDEWSNRGSAYAPAGANPPAADECLPSSSPDAFARLMQYDVFPDVGLWRQAEENGGVREARVLRYREKRRTRLFSKKIRYEVRKVNADNRPRMKVKKKSVKPFCVGKVSLLHHRIRVSLDGYTRFALVSYG